MADKGVEDLAGRISLTLRGADPLDALAAMAMLGNMLIASISPTRAAAASKLADVNAVAQQDMMRNFDLYQAMQLAAMTPRPPKAGG